MKITPTRRAVLQAVSECRVYGARSDAFGNWKAHEVDRAGFRMRTVTRAAVDLESAGLIERGEAESPSFYARRYYRLTDAGRESLEGTS